MAGKQRSIGELYKKYVQKQGMYLIVDQHNTNRKRVADGKDPTSLKEKAMQVRVLIVDVRTGWGRVDALITPLDGEGSVWVAVENTTGGTSKLTLIDEKD